MMARYIDTDTLNWWDDLFMKGKNDSGVWVRYKDVQSFINNAPTEDVAPIKHAKYVSEIVKREDWRGKMQSYYQFNSCSNCHTALNGNENYCSYCGAKMDGKENEE